MAFITEWNHTTGNFTLPLRSGYTYNMVVDWGDGSPTSNVTAYNDAAATHNYTVAGTYQISITGTCGAWYINNGTVKSKITKVIDWGNVGFTGNGLQYAFYGCNNLSVLPAGSIPGANAVTAFYGTFKGCTGLTSIPAGLFNNNTAVASSGFQETFYGCTGITSIPVDLFRYNTSVSANGFYSTFYGCTGITSIPVDLFRYNTNINVIFQNTFYGCTGLTSIPAGLFQYNATINGSNAFNATFQNCTGITSIPTDLFRYNTAVASFAFQSTFRGCTGLTSIPADLFRYNTAAGNFSSCFYGCTGLASIPVDLFRYNTASTSFNSTFYGCSNLSEIPDNLFKYNTAVTTFQSCFEACIKLKLNPTTFYADGEQATRFLNKSVSFASCFLRTSYTGTEAGTAPDLWNCSFGTGTPTKTNCFGGAGNTRITITNFCYIPSDWGITRCARLETIGSGWQSATQEKITVTTSITIPAPDTFQCYVGANLGDIENPANLVTLNLVSGNIYQAIATTPGDNTTWYVRIKYSEPGGVNPETLNLTVTHYEVSPVVTTTINITNPDNYRVLNSPSHSYNHGSLFHNGYIYGSARNNWNANQYTGTSFFKLNAADYTDLTQITYYRNQLVPAGADIIAMLDQIVYCKGFIWAMGINYGESFLLRIHPDTLEHILFITAEIGTKNQPIGTDGNYLYLSGDTSVKKYDTDLLLGTPASYGFTGAAPVALPANTVLATCSITALDPTNPAYVHSFVSDGTHIYLAVTTGWTKPNGWNETIGQYTTCFQKINIASFTTVGSVGIPSCTDDMVQNDSYVFLCPELQNTTEVFNGTTWGLIAVKKSDLSIKYLKALAPEFNTVNEADRSGYGVFYFQDKISVQLIASKKTVVIRTDEIESWGPDFPIGGATEAIYKFQLNGVDMSAACNELVMDDNGYIHTNTWEINTIVFKFTFENIFPQTFNALTLFHNSAQALLEYLNPKRGHSIRCVQDAPGVADGVTGTATDYDGNQYDTIVIKEKRWFVQNLKATHYRNGDPVPEVTDATAWAALSTGARSAYDNNQNNV